MSIWDYMRRSDKVPAPQSIDRSPDGTLVIRWTDGRGGRVPVRDLRLACPCAGCVDERTGQRTLDPEHVPADVEIVGMEAVGNYAVRIAFSDGHDTGLFDWNLLRRLAG